MSYKDSTQKDYFMFDSIDEIEKIIKQVNETSGTIISSDECQKIVNYYATHLHKICTKIELPESVIYNIMLLYKHFYLNQSPQLFHPRNIMIACICLGKKLEEYRFENESNNQNIDLVCEKIVQSKSVKQSIETLKMYSRIYESVIFEVLHFQLGKFNKN